MCFDITLTALGGIIAILVHFIGFGIMPEGHNVLSTGWEITLEFGGKIQWFFHFATALEKWWQKNATTKFLGKCHVDHLMFIFQKKIQNFRRFAPKSPNISLHFLWTS